MDGIVVLWKTKKDFNVLTILSSFESFRLIFTPACSTFRTWRAADLTPVFYSCLITWSFRWPPLVGECSDTVSNSSFTNNPGTLSLPPLWIHTP